MKQIFVLTISLTLSAVLFAQSNVKFGIKGGLNIATTSNNNDGANDWKAGLNAGFLAHIHLTPQVALQPEIEYSSQGNKYTIPSNGEHQLNLNYINVPVLLQYMFGNGFRLQTGPQLGFLVGVNDKHNGHETGLFTSSDFKNTDVSWSFGLGYVGLSGLGVDARYNLGLSNINNIPSDTPQTPMAKLHNSVVQVGLFYMFDQHRKRYSHWRK